jgi:glycosyltransferase involved in cell wall biosynthesis
MKSKVTILCSSYNSSKWIDQYLSSLNDQTEKHFDIIFVDANSTDDSLDKIKKYNFRLGINKKVIELNERISIYGAWNLAIKSADTKYVMNINTDDRLYPEGLETMLLAAERIPNAVVLYGLNQIVSDENHTVRIGWHNWEDYSHNVLYHHCICGPFPLLDRETIIAEGMFNEKFTRSGDYEMWLRLSSKGHGIVRIPVYIGSYYLNPEGMSTAAAGRAEVEKQDEEIRSLYSKR